VNATKRTSCGSNSTSPGEKEHVESSSSSSSLWVLKILEEKAILQSLSAETTAKKKLKRVDQIGLKLSAEGGSRIPAIARRFCDHKLPSSSSPLSSRFPQRSPHHPLSSSHLSSPNPLSLVLLLSSSWKTFPLHSPASSKLLLSSPGTPSKGEMSCLKLMTR